ncbi:Ribokinase-like protein [Lactarius sanguifluus]|nr:Ribokinase-like protein [Lactarius sanguifluus]
MSVQQSYSLFCLGNPLLDMQVTNGEDLLKKYDLKPNDAILAGEKHFPIYNELVKEHQVAYVAGGAAQNAARGAAYVLPPNSVVYTGCVGNDIFAKKLREANEREGLAEAYLVKEGEQTGACAVVITGHHRSLVTNLRAAEKFEKAHLATPEIARLIDGAKFFYVEGYFLTHGLESAIEVAKKASDSGKVFAINLSAPFIPQFFKVQLEQLFPYCDFVIGNESEAAAWASAAGLLDKNDIPTIARSIAMLPKLNPSRQRTVIITQGPESTVVVSAADPDKPKIFSVDRLDDRQIVDTNGAGDAFAGGLLGALVAGKSVDEAVLAGHKMGAMCVQLVGPQYPWPKVTVL